jgi:outer membrane protein OmpA-like peptidoglycan-associated protein
MYSLNVLIRLMSLSVFLCTTGKVYAQLTPSLNTYDSSVIPDGRASQQNDFLNHAYPFPAKPRNAWEIGVKAGAISIAGDVRSNFPAYGAALHVRKALGYVFSLRAQAGFGIAKGLNFLPSSHYSKNPAWTKSGYNPANHHVFYNYKTNIYEVSLQGVVTLSNIRFHRSRSGFNFYVFGGIGGMVYDTQIDALKGDGTNYTAEFEAIYNKYNSSPGGFGYKNRKNIKKDLENLLDGHYETAAETDPGQPTWQKPFRPLFNVGGGVQIKLNKTLSLAIEDQFSIVKTDLLDGQQWQENGIGSATAQTRDFDSYNFVSIGLNIAVGRRSVEPLWWVNPLDYAYSEINQPRHMKLPHPVLADADGDGIADQFDQEPNTPAGTPIDARGTSLDTDGDGVPDFKDKELITPTQCQPVNGDGVGKCPPPSCCDSALKYMNGIVPHTGNSNMDPLPGIYFKGRSVKPDNTAKSMLQHIGQLIRNNPERRIKVTGYGASSKSAQQLSWERVNAVINYLVEREGINPDRFIFIYGETGGEMNTVDLEDANGERGASHVPPPYPQLSRQPRHRQATRNNQ